MSLNYCCAAHKDRDLGFAIGSWFIEHGKQCTCDKDDGTIQGWYFYFPELKMAVKLRDGVVIIWDASEFGHATVFPLKASRNKHSCIALCAVTQIQEVYAKEMFNRQLNDL